MGLLTQKERRGRTYVQPQSSGLLTAGRRMRGLLSDAADWAGDNPLDAAALATSPIPIVGDVVGGVADAKTFYDDPSWMNAGLGLAGLLPFVPGGLAGTFAGIGAKTADVVALRKAEALEAAGENADDIWRETGWGRGADGKWRFEIDDSGMDLTDNALAASLGAGKYRGKDLQTNFSGAVKHPDLLEAYDLSNDVDIGLMPTNRGSYDINGAIKAKGTDPKNIKSVLLHEIQHELQRQEGFQGGGNVSQFIDEIRFEKAFWEGEVNRLNEVLKKTVGTPSYEKAMRLREEASKELSKLSGYFGGTEEAAFKRYQSLQGETEARNVQTRLNMNAAERRQTPPWATEDVPRDQQIVRFRD
jgi:hypothetical protein